MKPEQARFSAWLTTLNEDVIQGEYGYEPGEFAVFPELWLPLFQEGVTPQAAFRRALDGFAEALRIEDEARATNWRRIQAEDAAAVARYKAAQS